MKIILEGEPCNQKRMKARRLNGFVVMYDPSAKDKARIRSELKQYENVKFEHVTISFIFYFSIPKAVRKKVRAEMNAELTKCEKKPDVDNLLKLYLDCLDGILFTGDQIVMLGSCIKLYSPKPRTVILLQETSSKIEPSELDDLVREEVFDKPNLD